MSDCFTYTYDIENLGEIETVPLNDSILRGIKELAYTMYNDYYIMGIITEYRLEIISVIFPDVIEEFTTSQGFPDKFTDLMYDVLTEDMPFLKEDGKGGFKEDNTPSGDNINIIFTRELSEVFEEATKSKKTAKIEKKFTVEDLPNLIKTLNSTVIGQEKSVQNIINTVKLQLTGLSNYMTLFFAGPTGVGKSLLAQTLGKNYTGNYYKFNCAEYAKSHEYSKLIGAPAGYVGSERGGILTEKAQISNKWVFLFDEAEKAHPKFFEFLLSLLDTGKLTDNKGHILDFSQSIFIFTSNIGYKHEEKGYDLGFNGKLKTSIVTSDVILDKVKAEFAPEFINRLNYITCFNYLTKESIKDIVKIELGLLPVKVTPKLITHILNKGYSEEYGAREVKRTVDSELKLLIAEALLESGAKYRKGMSKMFTPTWPKGVLTLNKIQKKKLKTIKSTE